MTNNLLIETSCGILLGYSEEGTDVFRGIPYAQPPVGNRRFRAPIPTKWAGIRDATASGPAAYQVNSDNMKEVVDLAESLQSGELPGLVPGPPYVFKTYDQKLISEDCLYLDIWKPATNTGLSGKNLPVYVYYHGGANIVSSGSFDAERGANLAREENIIVVRPNYRMGALGWVHFGLICEELSEAINLGLQDQIAALNWVYENIDAFGGDRDNITIGGESAGGTAVSHLLVNPGAQKIVRRAIIQSLSPFNVWCTQEKEEAMVIARKYLEILNLENTSSDIINIEPAKFLAVHSILLRTFPPDTNHAWSPVGGVVDRNIIPQNPALMLSTQPYPRKDFELMIGFAKDEWQFFRGHSATFKRGNDADVISIVEQVFGKDTAPPVFKSYHSLYPNHTTSQLLNDIMSMQMFKFSSLEIASNFASQGLPVYVFQFSFDLPAGGGAIHTGDMPFIFRNFTAKDMEKWPAFEGINTDLVAQLSMEFGDMYGSFIRRGNTGKPGRWPGFDDKTQTILWFGSSIDPIPNLLKKEMEIFQRAGIVKYYTLLEQLRNNVRQQIKQLW